MEPLIPVLVNEEVKLNVNTNFTPTLLENNNSVLIKHKDLLNFERRNENKQLLTHRYNIGKLLHFHPK